MELHRPCSGAEQVIELLATAPSGRSLVARIVPLLEQRELEIDLCTARDLLRRFGNKRLQGVPAAAFSWDGKRGKLHLEFGKPVGLLAPLFLHEASHALDAEYLASFAEGQSLWQDLQKFARTVLHEASHRTGKRVLDVELTDMRSEDTHRLAILKDRAERFDHHRQFRAEKKAHEALHLWVTEAVAAVPGYAAFLGTLRESGYVLDRPLQDDEIIRSYGLNPAYFTESRRTG